MPHKFDSHYLGSIWQNEKNIDKVPAHLRERSTLFFGFAYISLAVFGLIMAMGWYLLDPGLARIHFMLPKIVFFLLCCIWLVLFVDVSLMASSVIIGRNCIPYYHSSGRVGYLMPLVMKLGMVLKVIPDRMISSFLTVNNRLMQLIHKKRKKENILVLLPRCLQHFSCNQPVVTDINACKSCGKCDIVKLVKLNTHYRLVTAIATGGHLAHQLISELKPHGIIAIACERELMQGLKGIGKIPIIAIANARPEGPCKNTTVDVDAIERAIKLFKNI